MKIKYYKFDKWYLIMSYLEYDKSTSNATHQFLAFFLLFVSWNYGIQGDKDLHTSHKTVLFVVH